MCGSKCIIGLVIVLIIRSGQLISVPPRNGTLDMLRKQPTLNGLKYKEMSAEFQLNPIKFSQDANLIQSRIGVNNKYGLIQNYPYAPDPYKPQYPYSQYVYRPNNPFPNPIPRPPPALPPGYQRYPQNFMDALQSIVYNDQLQCVPRLLCELTSGRNSNRKNESFLPFNINMESLLGFVSAVTGAHASPLLQFGKAAVLGYTSKGNPRSCVSAYPTCPEDPDKLVEYLNNYNGGFFRFFNGLPPANFKEQPQFQLYQKHPSYAGLYPYPSQQNPHYSYHKYQQPHQNLNLQNFQHMYAQKRIQNNPNEYLNKYSNSDIKFPNAYKNHPPNTNIVAFPNQYYRKQKSVAFPEINYNFKKPDSRPIMIFPDRTGTGELKLDLEEIENYNQYPMNQNYFSPNEDYRFGTDVQFPNNDYY